MVFTGPPPSGRDRLLVVESSRPASALRLVVVSSSSSRKEKMARDDRNTEQCNDNDRKTDSFSKYDFFGSGRNSSGSLRSGQIEGLVQHRVPGYYTVYPVLIPGTRMDL
eukprot:3912703-Rhodomonas_salina.2